MSVEIAALRVGGSVAQLAVGRWLAGRATRDAAGKDLVELIKTGFPDEIKRRRVQRQFEGVADPIKLAGGLRSRLSVSAFGPPG